MKPTVANLTRSLSSQHAFSQVEKDIITVLYRSPVNLRQVYSRHAENCLSNKFLSSLFPFRYEMEKRKDEIYERKGCFSWPLQAACFSSLFTAEPNKEENLAGSLKKAAEGHKKN